MFIEKLILKGFKCFKDKTEIKLDSFNGIIGNNGSGKTAILEALSRMFGSDPRYRNIKSSDFFVPLGQTLEMVEKRELIIEVKIGFDDSDINIIPQCFNQMMVDSLGGKPYCRIRLEGVWEDTNIPGGEIEEKIYWITSSEKIINDSDKKILSLSDRSKIQVHYIPAIREPQKQMKHTTGTILYQLLKNIKWSNNTLDKFNIANNDLLNIFKAEKGIKTINQELSKSWKNLFNNKIYNKININPASTDLKTTLSKIEATFSPNPGGGEENQNKLSDGMKSLFYFTLITSMFEIQEKLKKNQEEYGFIIDSKNVPDLTIFAIEEPENHLSPHYFGKVIKSFRDTTKENRAQVIVTSHSPAIIKRVYPEEIRYVLQDTSRISTIKEIQLPSSNSEAYKFVKEAVKAYPELYFSKLVILGEGDSEEIVLPKIAAAYGIELDSSFVSIVPLGGRHVNHFWKLLNQLKISYITLLDYDRERGGGDWGRIKYILNQLREIGVETKWNDKNIQGDFLKNLNKRRLNLKEEKLFIDYFKKYNIFFSYPYDIDFSMFSNFPKAYKAIEEGRGPNISDKEKIIKGAIASVLKKEVDDIKNILKYKINDNYDIWFWYRYLFLGKGKPVSHINAFLSIEDEDIIKNVPQELKELVLKAKDLLGG